MADPTAPRNQQPTVLRAGNSTVQVNIQTPNAAGLSRNNYKQFDILADGVILNNSRTQTNTNLGGWIEANPWLAKGTAKVILNQVNSIHPSLLKGPVEVAVGSSITSSGNTTLSAGNDLTAKAANVQAGGTLNVNAGNDRVALLVAY
jgi:filamentous hemagglutinin